MLNTNIGLTNLFEYWAFPPVLLTGISNILTGLRVPG